MTIQQINDYVTFRANTNTTDYSPANRLISCNRWYQKIVSMILQSMDDWDFDDSNETDYPVATTPLVANQRDYSFPDSLKILQIKRIDLTYDGTNYYKAEEIDTANIALGLGNDSSIDGHFSKTSPVIDFKSNAFWIYPRASQSDVDAGAKARLEFLREPVEYTSAEVTAGTKEPGFDSIFHPMIPLGMIYDWCSAKGGSSPVLTALKSDIAAELNDYEQRLRKHYGTKQHDRTLQLKSVYSSNSFR